MGILDLRQYGKELISKPQFYLQISKSQNHFHDQETD